MRGKNCKNFLMGAATLALIAGSAWAANHHQLNGVWDLVPTRSILNGERAIETGTVTINDREGNVFVDRNFNFDDANRSVSTDFTTDARHNTSIKDASGFKSKAKWVGDVLQVSTLHDGITTVERYSLLGDGTMMMRVDRTGHPSETLYFQHQ
jgi:hypothetical protein